MIESVKIIHEELKGGGYRFLADYFRLAGVYVSECILKNYEKKGDFSAVIIIKSGLGNEEVTQLSGTYDYVVVMEDISLNCEKQEKIDYLSTLFEKIAEINPNVWQKEIEALKIIAQVYVEYDLLYHRNVFSYFYEKADLVQNAQNCLVDAYLFLSEEMKKDGNIRAHLIYAKIMLVRYINETCQFLNQYFLFDTGKCLKELDRALSLEPSFSNVYLLKAMLTEIDENFKYESKTYYELGLKNMEDLYFASYPYYRFGRYYEKVIKDETKAREYYEKAIRINDREYRAIYKLILYAKKDGKYQEAIENCKKICNILMVKKEENYLQPREYEYLFKAYWEMVKIYRNYLSDTEALNEAVSNRDSVCPKDSDDPESFCANGFYKQVFQNEEQKFLELTNERLNSVVIACEQ